MIPTDEQTNYDTFRDCMSDAVIKILTRPEKGPRRRATKGKKAAVQEKASDDEIGNDAEELGEFIEYLSEEAFPSLPEELRKLSYIAHRDDAKLREKYGDPLPASTLEATLAPVPTSVLDSLVSYAILPPATEDPTSLQSFLTPVLAAYIYSVTAPPPVWANTRASACEICERDWIPLTYHHLIPRSTHKKVKEKGWHDESILNSVAWLCRACHSRVHSVASNEELAKEWFTVERLRTREDIQRWAAWVGGVRWKKR